MTSTGKPPVSNILFLYHSLVASGKMVYTWGVEEPFVALWQANEQKNSQIEPQSVFYDRMQDPVPFSWGSISSRYLLACGVILEN